jgi:hypothetical protein
MLILGGAYELNGTINITNGIPHLGFSFLNQRICLLPLVVRQSMEGWLETKGAYCQCLTTRCDPSVVV